VVDFDGDAKNTLMKALTEVSGLEPAVPVRPQVVEGHAAEVLVGASRGADLLVVGSRGRHGGFISALLRSVSLYCTLHAHCPVLAIYLSAHRAMIHGSALLRGSSCHGARLIRLA
jgi:nucleotide-binding universal stress UspA family protein